MTEAETALAPISSAHPPAPRAQATNLQVQDRNRENRMTPAQKASIVLIALGPETASRLMTGLGEQRLKRFARTVKDLKDVPAEVVEQVIAEFLYKVEDTRSVGGGIDEARRFLSEIMDKDQVNQIMGDLDIEGRSVWSLLGDIDDARLAAWLRTEHPQVAAIALSRLSSVKAAKVLELFEDEMADDIIVRMGPAASANSGVAQRIGDVIARDFLPTALARRGKQEPADMIAGIMNHVSGPVRDRLLETMTNMAPKLADSVRKVMFTFDHIPERVQPRDVGMITKAVDELILLTALKPNGDQSPVAQFIFGNISKRLGERLREDLAAMPDVTRREAEGAQAEIVSAIIELRDSGAMKMVVKEEE